NALRQAFQLVAMIISIALTPIVVDAIGWSTTAIIYGILGGAVILYMTFTSHEEHISIDEPKPKIWDSVKTLLTNRKFWVAGVSNAFYSAAMSMVMAGLPLYAKYKLGIGGWKQALLMGLVLVVAIVSVAIWAAFLKRYDLVKVWRWALLALAISFVPLYFAQGYIMALICASLVGFGFAGVITTMDLIHARVMDEDKAKHNVRREGIISNALGFMNRLNSLFTGGAFLLLKSLYGYESGDVPGSRPDQVALFIIAIFPLIMTLLSYACSYLSDFKVVKSEITEQSLLDA
ncbi:MAG TPA: MFS transporter, partial [Anaerolineaceae bacterium]|nr:MFS transporter [Anaerolineaceae bacterium]